MLATLFLCYVVGSAILRPEVVGEAGAGAPVDVREAADEAEPDNLQTVLSIFGMCFIIFAVLGGIWFGIFTPTEGAGAGAALALLFAVAKGMRWSALLKAIFAVGQTAAPILILLLMAALYSRTLAMTGVTTAIQDFFLNTGLEPWMILVCMVLVWFLLGMVIDSISIMLLTVPIFEPLAMALGYDQVAFAIVGILAIEAGLLTPPFGLLVYTVKAAIQDDDVSVRQIFVSSIPYWIVMLAGIVAIITFPQIANYLPDLLF
jgi:TRAP-type C4-dicarboxylate transport system permease large subunit